MNKKITIIHLCEININLTYILKYFNIIYTYKQFLCGTSNDPRECLILKIFENLRSCFWYSIYKFGLSVCLSVCLYTETSKQLNRLGLNFLWDIT